MTTQIHHLEVLLANRGNPDHRQDPTRPCHGSPADYWLAVADYESASGVCQNYIAALTLGGGNWIGGAIREVGTTKIVALVSFNGKVWAVDEDDFDPSDKAPPLFTPKG
jgi:hypothetical protein